jgi:hypothetical protein
MPAKVTVNIDTTSKEDDLSIVLNGKVETDVRFVSVHRYKDYKGNLEVHAELESATEDANGVRKYTRTVAEELANSPQIKIVVVDKLTGDWEGKAIADIIDYFSPKKGK